MASGKDKLIGWSLVGLSSIICIYYTIWVIILDIQDYWKSCRTFSIIGLVIRTVKIIWNLIDNIPFVDKDQPIHSVFPDILYAVAIPLIAGVLGLLFIGCFIAITLLRSVSKDKSS